MGLWTYAEFTTTIICSCIPSLARLAQHLKPSLLSLGHRITSLGSSQHTIRASQKINDAPNGGGIVEEHGFSPRKRKESYVTISNWELSNKGTPTAVSDEEALRV
jgi:hypothetical protein